MGSAGLGKAMIVFGAIILFVGVIVFYSDRFPFLKSIGRLPGDFNFKGERWQIHFPFMTSILLSILLTALMWIVSYFSRRG